MIIKASPLNRFGALPFYDAYREYGDGTLGLLTAALTAEQIIERGWKLPPRFVRKTDSRTFTVAEASKTHVTVQDEQTGEKQKMKAAAFDLRFQRIEGLYAITAEALEPYRQGIEARIREQLVGQVERMTAALAAKDWNLNEAFPHPNGNLRRNEYRAACEARQFAQKWSNLDGERNKGIGYQGGKAPHYLAAFGEPELNHRLDRSAKRTADDIVKAYIWKLTTKQEERNKTSQPISASYVGSLWTGSTLTYAHADGKTDAWNTHIILNVSCLGKVFNQYPTRLAK